LKENKIEGERDRKGNIWGWRETQTERRERERETERERERERERDQFMIHSWFQQSAKTTL
jgi:hypothetical protein